MAPSARLPTASLLLREQNGEPYFEAKFRHLGRQVKRRVGPAWLTWDDGSASWRARRGRVADGYFDTRKADVRAAELVAMYVAEVADVERIERERRTRGVTFREVAHPYLEWLEQVRNAKPRQSARTAHT